jgi:hypothetical protein
MKLVLALAVVLFGASRASASELNPPKISGTFVVSGHGWCQPTHDARFYEYAQTAKIDSTKNKISYFDSGTLTIGDQILGQLNHAVGLKGSFQVTDNHDVIVNGAPAFAEFGLDENNEVSNFTLLRLDPDKTCTYQETYTRVSNVVP